MNIMTRRIATLSAAFVVGASLLSPAFAAQNSRYHARTAPYAQSEGYASEGYAQGSLPSNGWGNAYNQAPSSYGFDPVQAQRNWNPNRCITDEGYGRWSYCDGGDN
jgi:hypothetical protein